MSENEQLIFDEVDLTYLRDAVYRQIATTDWDVTNPGEWLRLVALKGLEEKLNRALDAIYDNNHA